MVCLGLGRPYLFNFLKGCLPQILVGPFLNSLTQMFVQFTSCFVQGHSRQKERFSDAFSGYGKEILTCNVLKFK